MSAGTVTTTEAKLQVAYAALGAYRNAAMFPGNILQLIENAESRVRDLERTFAAEQANDIEAWKPADK